MQFPVDDPFPIMFCFPISSITFTAPPIIIARLSPGNIRRICANAEFFPNRIKRFVNVTFNEDMSAFHVIFSFTKTGAYMGDKKCPPLFLISEKNHPINHLS